MVGGVKETWVVLGRTPVQKGLMAPSPAWAQGGGPHGMSGQMDLRKTMNVPFCERNRMTLRPKGSTEVIKKPHKEWGLQWVKAQKQQKCFHALKEFDLGQQKLCDKS